MNLLLTILFDGITYASWLFVVALGLTLVFGVLKILNIAHGSFYAVGAYAGASLVAWTMSLQISPALGVVALLMAAVGVAALVGIAVLCGVVTWWVLNRTRKGKIVTAVIHSAEVASSMGVKVSRIYTGAFTAGVFLAAIGGALTAPMISVQPGLSVGVIITSFAVVIIGGLGSIEGAAIGALIVGLARAASVHIWPPAELFSIYVVMAAILVFKPEGLFQRTQARKI